MMLRSASRAVRQVVKKSSSTSAASSFHNLSSLYFANTNAAASAATADTATATLPSIDFVKNFGVIGAGQMGTGIALVGAMHAKLDVLLMDNNQQQIDKSLKFTDSLLKKDVDKKKITAEEADAVRGRIRTTTRLEDFEKSTFVVEAATENTELKLNIFRKLNEITPSDAILASNTSSISITKIAGACGKAREGNVIGMHFMNPVPVMKLVELVVGLGTSDETYQKTQQLAVAMGKTTTKSIDSPGFIANRILMPYINEAVQAYSEGVGSAEDIDTTMKLGTNVPMGPLTLADFIGLDTCLAIMRVLHTEFGDSKYRPANLLVKMVDAGWLGRKTGRGFYTYPQTK
eukprot:GEZU01025400.1.p1 GENE.GEZU01025400.1~~GEZU01025400.1.p1  ORF type:complete len:346 (+),score=149.09 GEZU01025400.1:102-1139(+)